MVRASLLISYLASWPYIQEIEPEGQGNAGNVSPPSLFEVSKLEEGGEGGNCFPVFTSSIIWADYKMQHSPPPPPPPPPHK